MAWPRIPVLFWFALAAQALSVAHASAGSSAWFARTWQTAQGLPDNSVTGLAHTPEGYLWVSTHNGLTRFDGVQFKALPIPARSGRSHPLIRAMTLGRDNSLWLALEGGMAVGIGPDSTNLFTSADGLPNFRPLAITEDSAGAVWIGYSDGSACRIADGRVMRFTGRDGLPGIGPCWLISDAAGQVWFAKAGRIGVFNEERFETLLALPERAVRIGPARDAGIWICASSQVMKYDKGEEPIALGSIENVRAGAEPTVVFEDRSGALWIGTSTSGLYHWAGGGFELVGTAHSEILSLAEDREGNIWAGTGGGGLNRLRPRVLELQNKNSGLPLETVRSVCEDAAGRLWAVGENGALVRRDGHDWKTLSQEDGWSGARATCVTGDGADGIWIGTYRGGLHHWRNGAFRVWQRSDGLGGDVARALMVDREGNLWIGLEAANGLQRFRDGEFRTFTQPSGSRTIRAMAQDRAGRVWLGTSDGFLLRVEGERLANETSRTVSPPRPIRSLHAAADGSLWIGYAAAGLGRLRDGQFARVGVEHGLIDENICGMAVDAGGWMWIASDRGVFQVGERELNAVADGRADRVRAIPYGRDEGLPSLQANYGSAPNSVVSGDGRIWFATRTGLAVVHPERVRPNRIPPPVLIERFVLDGHVQAFAPAVPLRLPPRHRNIEVEFTALSFIAPENVRFRYRLEGLDEEWHEAGMRRYASYSRLPAGNYRFQVTACNNAGVWNETGAMLSFVVQPFFWQTWWFRLAVVAAFTGGVIAVVRYVSFRRLRLRLRRLETEAALQRERMRISQDLHDDLGASLTQIALLSELAQNDFEQPAQARTHIDRIFRTARALTRSLDDIVWAVNPKNDTLEQFVAHLCTYAPDFLRSGGVRCRLDVPVEMPPLLLRSEVRHHLHLAVKESLHNIIKHSRATEVWLRLRVGGGALTMTIEDNGHGFAEEAPAPGQDGLLHLRQRMDEVGGTFAQQSRAGHGTTTVFTIRIEQVENPRVAAASESGI
jgi:signal transduction histidine kinase/ligand-binding sensor domain-containing protein